MKPFNGKKIIGKPDLTRGNKKQQADPQVMFDALDRVLQYDFVKQVSWTQYTPYFNDGDICEFGVNEPEVEFTFPIKTKIEEYLPGPSFRSWDLNYYTNKLPEFSVLTKEFKKDFINFMASLVDGTNEDILYKTFGDHAEIIATKDSIIIESFKHE